MSTRYRFNRLELAGSLGDIGTLFPLAVGMILVNGLSPSGLFFTVGLFYILSGIYYGVTVPIQPMKVIGAYAVATAMSAPQIQASGFLMGLFLLVIGASGAITLIGRLIPGPVVRGVQLSTGTLLMAQGVRFIAGTSGFQALQGAAEPYLTIQNLGPLPVGVLIGVAGGLLTLLFLENRRFPAGLLVVVSGFLVGLFFGTHEGFEQITLGLNLPAIFPFGVPGVQDFTFALLALALPQVPMTLGNAVIAYADLSGEYFGEDSQKVTYRASCITMALANFTAALLGGMPLCHGAGGLAAHYRFGARTAGSNLMIGAIFLLLAVFLGAHALSLVYLIPLSVLGVLLLFAGSQLALTIMEVGHRKDFFVALLILGITLASNLAVGFLAGIAVAYALKWKRLRV
ncbi:MAG: putative sulfate/molybdate transporter [Deltaproteobacteria bacterium]|nr:putative sulfate/molybdate transporter [Deltaproteobacteria bacterium]